MRPMRSLDICFLPVCSLDRPVSTLDIQCAYWIFSVLTGCPVTSLAYPVCTLGENPARFQCAYWTRLPVCTLDIQCTHWISGVYTGVNVLAGRNICTWRAPEFHTKLGMPCLTFHLLSKRSSTLVCHFKMYCFF